MEKLAQKCENMQRKMKNSAFFRLKFMMIDAKFDKFKENEVRLEVNRFLDRIDEKKIQISNYEREILERTNLVRTMSLNLQNSEKAILEKQKQLQERQKSLEEIKSNSSKLKKYSNIFEKIEGIENQVHYFSPFKINENLL